MANTTKPTQINTSSTTKTVVEEIQPVVAEEILPVVAEEIQPVVAEEETIEEPKKVTTPEFKTDLVYHTSHKSTKGEANPVRRRRLRLLGYL